MFLPHITNSLKTALSWDWQMVWGKRKGERELAMFSQELNSANRTAPCGSLLSKLSNFCQIKGRKNDRRLEPYNKM